ncbi:2-phosphosulfolactate phosphatase [Pedobacter cryophilus]|uniref:Probable 2-phosphosulfolactate phosphatase n=1 Tax=Pedobacter cryophilus TaxID=2571271 RepID=A0A4U1C710_9SPHI|nr:2-phosphosulfolactate phosphatase [Pedobacter cryophilus]TKC00434.1 2-phosphosulfolactate phosphatase [Pedobacter cryophilus]
MDKRKIEVCFTPALLPIYDISNAIVVVIDIFRATSSICYGIENGAAAIIPVATVEECKSYEIDGFLLAAERDGKVVEGFDFGNSPFAYAEDKVKDKTIVLTTTNGTYAIDESKKTAFQVIIGSFLNLDAICNYLKSQDKDVFLLCAGWKNKFNLEDTLFAGAVVHHLKNEDYYLDDSSISADDLYNIAKHDLEAYTAKTSHSERLKKLGIEEDIKFCLNVNIATTIPVLEGNKLVKLILN